MANSRPWSTMIGSGRQWSTMVEHELPEIISTLLTVIPIAVFMECRQTWPQPVGFFQGAMFEPLSNIRLCVHDAATIVSMNLKTS